MKMTKKRRAKLVEAGRKGGRSKSERKIAAVRENGRRHVARVKPLAEIVAEQAEQFRRDHLELFDGVE
jgi:hypothetical protein